MAHSERAVSPLAVMKFPCGVKTSLSGVKVLLISEHDEPRTSVPGVFACVGDCEIGLPSLETMNSVS